MSVSGRLPRVVFATICWLSLASLPILAVTKWKGLQPGASMRGAVEEVLGAPTRNLGPALFEYKAQPDTGAVTVEYRSDNSVERIEVQLARPVSRTPLITTFQLAGVPGLKRTAADGKLVEYFAGEAAMVFFYNGNEDASGVSRVGFYSQELLERLTGSVRTTPTSAASDWKTQKQLLNPTECQDVFLWAQGENEPAKRSKNAARRQAILDILIASQKGECDRARRQAAAYKQSYK